MKTTRILAMLAAIAAGSGQAQQVEYVTRNVQPTHAVRFNSQPLRITITDRGERVSRGDLEPVTDGRKHHAPRHVLRGGRGSYFGFGGVVHRSDDRRNNSTESLVERNRSRTVYGSERPSPSADADQTARSEASSPKVDPEARAAAKRARDERRQRLYDRLLPLIEARREKLTAD